MKSIVGLYKDIGRRVQVSLGKTAKPIYDPNYHPTVYQTPGKL